MGACCAILQQDVCVFPCVGQCSLPESPGVDDLCGLATVYVCPRASLRGCSSDVPSWRKSKVGRFGAQHRAIQPNPAQSTHILIMPLDPGICIVCRQDLLPFHIQRTKQSQLLRKTLHDSCSHACKQSHNWVKSFDF